MTTGPPAPVESFASGAGAAVRAPGPLERHRAIGVVIASVLATAISPATLVNMPFGLFIPELEREFHWPRTTITAALSVFLVVLVVLLPVAGAWIDRVGARRFAIPSIAGYALLVASLSLLGPSRLQFYATFAAIAAIGVGAQSISFLKVLSTWFDRRRGFAIGLCMAGFGIGFAVIPLLTQWLIGAVGWRGAYVGLALLALCVPLPAVWWLLHDAPLKTDRRLVMNGVTTEAHADGLSLRDALVTRELWLLGGSFALASFALNGVQSQLVPLLQGRGFSGSDTALALSAIGIGSFPSRIVIGWLIDRVFAPRLALVLYAAAGIAIGLIAGGRLLMVVLTCSAVIGVSIGAENDVLGFLVGRYFGLRAFAQIYSTLLGSYLLGAAAGPLIMAWSYDRRHDYSIVPSIAIGTLIISSLLLLLLGRYPGRETHDRA